MNTILVRAYDSRTREAEVAHISRAIAKLKDTERKKNKNNNYKHI